MTSKSIVTLSPVLNCVFGVIVSVKLSLLFDAYIIPFSLLKLHITLSDALYFISYGMSYVAVSILFFLVFILTVKV